MPRAAGSERGSELIVALRAEPEATAIFSDLDGTLAPIVPLPDQVSVAEGTRDLLARLAATYALVGCVSGRRAAEARAIVGLDQLAYIGNHGFERLEPGALDPQAAPAVHGHEREVDAFAEQRFDVEHLAADGLRLENKGAILALHWRGAPSEERAQARARAIAADAVGWNLVPHWGRKVLELRPPVALDKGTALAEMLEERHLVRALYAGDDRTDIDAFRALRGMVATGDLQLALCVGITSSEGPPELREEADIIVAEPTEYWAILARLVT